MGKMFGNLTDTNKLEASQDKVGGGFTPFPSGLYDGTIKLAYAGQSKNGAQSVTLHVDINGKELRETIYITNRKGENFYVDKNDATKKHPLPGFTLIDDICLLITQEGLVDQETETKTVKLYNFDEGKEVNTPVECLTALHGQPISLGVICEIVDKNVQDQGGNWVPGGETREQNKIDKVFDPETGRTVNEYRNEVATPEFRDAWAKKNDGAEPQNNAKGAAKGGAGASGIGRPGAAAGGNGDAPAKKPLFGKK